MQYWRYSLRRLLASSPWQERRETGKRVLVAASSHRSRIIKQYWMRASLCPRVRASRLLLPTLKPDEVVHSSPASHTQHVAGRSLVLLQRAGFIRQSSSGFYSMLPLALRSLDKIERIIDEELQNVGCQKLSLPLVLSSNLWKQTGRWEMMGSEMFRLKDRKGSEFCLGPTHEEEITNLVSTTVTSVRQLPQRLYQIDRKYRDEMRPRGGLLRAREFVMKDLYSFDATTTDALSTYDEIVKAYRRIFSRVGLPVSIAEADMGAIGGIKSHEFHVECEAGEDTILNCDKCGHTANVECANAIVLLSNDGEDKIPLDTWLMELFPFIKSAAASSISMPLKILYGFAGDDRQRPIIVIGIAGREFNTLRLYTRDGQPFAIPTSNAPEDEVRSSIENNATQTTFLIDVSLRSMFDLHLPSSSSIPTSPCASSLADSTAKSPVYSIDWLHIVKAQTGDVCGHCTPSGFIHSSPHLGTSGSPSKGKATVGHFHEKKALEVAHAFYLGDRYSRVLGACYTDVSSTSSQSAATAAAKPVPKPTTPVDEKDSLIPMQMGCFGIGVSRLLAAIVETKGDERGIAWPLAVAPYRAIVMSSFFNKAPSSSTSLSSSSSSSPAAAAGDHVAACISAAEHIYEQLRGMFPGEVVLDDRAMHLGARLKDAELIGFPFVIVVGRDWRPDAGKRLVELHQRASGAKQVLDVQQAIDVIRNSN